MTRISQHANHYRGFSRLHRTWQLSAFVPLSRETKLDLFICHRLERRENGMLRDEDFPGLPGVRKNEDAIRIYPERGALTVVLFASTRSPGDKLTKWPATQNRLSSRLETTSDRK